MKRCKQNQTNTRRGSTLVIVIALLGLLTFTGMVFYTFASQELASANYFSEAAKAQTSEPANVFDWGLRHILVGPNDNEVNSILYSPTRRHSLVRNQFGNDLSPHTGQGLPFPIYNAGVPELPGGIPSNAVDFMLDMVDSPMAWGLMPNQDAANAELSNLFERRGAQQGILPSPDVDYTYPDLNNMFLAYRGYAIRDNAEDVNNNGTLDAGEDRNGNGVLDVPTPRYEAIPVTIPSYFRPQYMKTSGTTRNGFYVPTDPNWATEDPTITALAKRSFRPHPSHLVRNQQTNDVLPRYLTAAAAASNGVASGGFPFLPGNDGSSQDDPAIQGELGFWTGSHPRVYELDVDNDQFSEVDANGTSYTTKEGIWMDLHFPLQEHVDSGGFTRLYVVLHSFTIYDLDSLINVNVHGNLNNMTRTGNVPAIVSSGSFGDRMLSASHHGLGPHEINPTYALRRDTRPPASGTTFESQIPADARNEFTQHYGRGPLSAIEQANMELFWLLTGRADYDTSGAIDDIIPGRWGDVQNLYFALTGAKEVGDYPRPGRSDNSRRTVSAGGGPRFGGAINGAGRAGYDDNQNAYEGEALLNAGRVRSYGKPVDFGGTGRNTTHNVTGFAGGTPLATPNGGNPLNPIMSVATNPASWPRYFNYNIAREMPTTSGGGGAIRYTPRYIFGVDQTFNNGVPASDDLIVNPFFDMLFEDPLETIFYSELAQRPADNVFGPQDMFELHMTALDIANSQETPSDRMSQVAPWAFDASSQNRELITTYSNSFRYVPFSHPFGNDGRPGKRGLDDDGDGTVDEPDEVLAGGYRDSDRISRWWEFSADTDGADRDNDGFPDGDGNAEFPPAFGTTNLNGRPYSRSDPFRPQTRRAVTVEAGDTTDLFGQLPISINHVLDVDRVWDQLGPDGIANSGDETSKAPPEGTPEFLSYMQRSGLRFRPLTEHPDEEETGVRAETVAYTLELASDSDPNTFTYATNVRFPPQTPAQREFWARRDRQQLARDIYVLLYTLGGARNDAAGVVKNYLGINDPALVPDALDPMVPGNPHPEALYTHDQLRRMAQFAVNLVDSLDTDNVVTKFEYDKNLSNGWNLDDDPYTADFPSAVLAGSVPSPNSLPVADYNLVTSGGLSPEDSGVPDVGDIDGDGNTTEIVSYDRGVVYGVEAQQLAFDEVFAVRSPELTMDHPATPYNDEDVSGTIDAHDFLQIEITNVQPLNVSLGADATTKDNCVWRIARFDRNNGADAPIAAPNDFDRAIVLLQDALAGGFVPPGGSLTISTGSPELTSSGGVELDMSEFYVDYNSPNMYASEDVFERIAPDVDAATNDITTATRECDIDLHHTNHLSTGFVARVLEDDSSITGDGTVTSTKGKFLETLSTYAGCDTFVNNVPPPSSAFPAGRFASSGDVGFDLVLQRRVNPNMPSLSQTANPWVNVDRIRVTFTPFGITLAMTDPLDIQNELLNLRSNERNQPLNAESETTYPNTAKANHRYNSITNANSNALPQWNLYQPHFDRDFVSNSELLNLPVYGPELVTQRLDWSRLPPFAQGQGAAANNALISSASAMFLQPDFTDVTPGTAPNSDLFLDQANDNRWYRILQFVEVPSRVHRMLGNYLAQNRVPGKLNLNMLRHREVFAGLIDDPFLMDVAADANATPYYTGAGTDPGNEFNDGNFTHPAGAPTGRDRWHEFVNDRDGIVRTYDPGSTNSVDGAARVWAPGLPGSQPYRAATIDGGFESTIWRRLENDRADGNPASNRNWAEIGTAAQHITPPASSTTVERHQLLSKIANNTTTVSNSFIVFATAGYFEAYQDPATGLVQVGGAFDLDEDGTTADDHKRAIFLIDRSEAINAFDAGSGDFDWESLVKARLEIQ
ncbi:hypothetical protein [Fuerstiella marisgermanici]|uniref:Uncharacterized protein n=1 Tax=Fuerstiella marisgermanici TaxID=1891926 RepID=A0A1P8WFK8_9PLAN|nr:hypothetical protein [Fuerstiella marisgermanici]APZ92823.1 hypothetical protein Fuma_02435 [Fuerstiella marisgermanici]